jgi:hypothetical protein
VSTNPLRRRQRLARSHGTDSDGILAGSFPMRSPPDLPFREEGKLANPLRFALVFVLPLILINVVLDGCAARKPASSISPAFRLQSLNGGSLLLSPNILPQQSADAPVSFTIDGNSDSKALSAACTTAEGDFRLEPDPQNPNVRVVLPPPKSWLFGSASGADENDTIESLYAFLTDVDRAEAAGCFATTHSHARDYVLQSVPTRPHDSLLNAYGYRIERSGVNLKPNLRLKVERAYFSSSEKSDKNYLGVSNVLFDVTTDSEGSLRFQQLHAIQYSPDSLAQTDHEGSRDVAILNLKPEKHYRVLFYTHQVPTDRNFSAALIGANDTARLDSFEQIIRAASDADCSSLIHDGTECFEFRGFVTVSIQIPIELNGKPQFVDWGTKVEAVVPAKVQKSFKLQRRFADAYYDLKFSRGDDSILDLTLVGGDRLTW